LAVKIITDNASLQLVKLVFIDEVWYNYSMNSRLVFYVRPLTRVDISDATQLLRKSISNPDYIHFRENASDYDSYGAFDRQRRLVGMAAVEYTRHHGLVDAELKHLATAKQWQREHGIGSALLSLVEEEAGWVGANAVTLRAYSDAWDFYLRQGYSPVPESTSGMDFIKPLVHEATNVQASV
jgi:GNAT superfamily N-acetyltransferase